MQSSDLRQYHTNFKAQQDFQQTFEPHEAVSFPQKLEVNIRRVGQDGEVINKKYMK